MKKLLLILFLIPIYTMAQEEFSFELYFEDALGNKDTLAIGYDITGSHGVDLSFGEVNRINYPWNNDFEVRITDEFFKRNNSQAGTYHLKKQIIENGCDLNNWGIQLAIDIKATQFPIHVSWDSTLFDIDCLKGSVLTGVIPGGWWDTSGFRVFMKENTSFYINNSSNDPLYYTYMEGLDTIYTTWFTFADSTMLTAGVTSLEKSNLQVFPNPFIDDFKLITNIEFPTKSIEIMDIFGKKVDFEMEDNVFKIRDSASGIYFLNLLFIDGRQAQYKIVKN